MINANSVWSTERCVLHRVQVCCCSGCCSWNTRCRLHGKSRVHSSPKVIIKLHFCRPFPQKMPYIHPMNSQVSFAKEPFNTKQSRLVSKRCLAFNLKTTFAPPSCPPTRSTPTRTLVCRRHRLIRMIRVTTQPPSTPCPPPIPESALACKEEA